MIMLSLTKLVVTPLVKKMPSASRNKLILISSVRSMSKMPEEQKINVKGVDINYLKVGSGSHPVLLLPGTLGSIWTDFKPQVTNMDREKFTLIAWDPPGYGKSRPPNRTFPLDFFARDAGIAYELMKVIGYDKFSLIGWSGGGITSIFMAANNPESIDKMVILGTNSYLVPEELAIYKSVRNIDSWSERMRAPMIDTYGEGYFRSTWAAWVDGMAAIFEKNDGNICKDLLPKVKCPTLIMHGAKDVMLWKDHPTYLEKNIKDSKLYIFPEGGHNLHLRFWEEFNRVSTEFLINGKI
ncbi:valacyclovir hydrolase [Athalia rosae]|uniref:valacyclovir hydrolase n=1 Tax=Athalia rosae TaxID=37344 RepID=UPI0020349B8E|nr:valacyclovir hydrolase [Athalia rosae]